MSPDQEGQERVHSQLDQPFSVQEREEPVPCGVGSPLCRSSSASTRCTLASLPGDLSAWPMPMVSAHSERRLPAAPGPAATALRRYERMPRNHGLASKCDLQRLLPARCSAVPRPSHRAQTPSHNSIRMLPATAPGIFQLLGQGQGTFEVRMCLTQPAQIGSAPAPDRSGSSHLLQIDESVLLLQDREHCLKLGQLPPPGDPHHTEPFRATSGLSPPRGASSTA